MHEQSEGNNHANKINVFPVLHTIFFLLAGQKVDLFAPHGAIKSTLWPTSRKKNLFHPARSALEKALDRKGLSIIINHVSSWAQILMHFQVT